MKFRDYNEPICPFTLSGEGEMGCMGHLRGECGNCSVKERHDTEMEKDAQKVTDWWYEQLLLDYINSL